MKRTWWVKQVGFCLVVMAMLAGLAQADPIGTADVPQISSPSNTTSTGGPTVNVSVFHPGDAFTFNAFYYDPNPACNGVATTFVQLFIFNQEGLFIQQIDAGSTGFPGTKERFIGIGFGSSPVPPGTYKWTFLVRDCTNTKSVVLPEFVTFRVVAP